MHLPESASEGAKWFLLVGLAFFSADATSALIGRQLEIPDVPLPPALIGAIQENVPAQAAPPDLIKLLKTTERKRPAGQDEAGEEGDEGDTKSRPAAAKSASFSLRGTIAGANGAGLAILDVQGTTRVLSSGDTIEGFTISTVTAQSVTLESQGQSVVLQIASSDSNPTVLQQLKPPPLPEPSATPQDTEPVEEAGSTEPIQSLSELQNILDNPENFMGKGFVTKPEIREGEVVGMRVRLSDPTHPLSRLGVRDGDLVKSINDTQLEGPESLSAVYRALRNSQTIRFDVERNGQTETVEVQLDE